MAWQVPASRPPNAQPKVEPPQATAPPVSVSAAFFSELSWRSRQRAKILVTKILRLFFRTAECGATNINQVRKGFDLRDIKGELLYNSKSYDCRTALTLPTLATPPPCPEWTVAHIQSAIAMTTFASWGWTLRTLSWLRGQMEPSTLRLTLWPLTDLHLKIHQSSRAQTQENIVRTLFNLLVSQREAFW